MGTRYTTCRVLSGRGVQCTAEAVAPDAELKICARHLAEAMRLVRDASAGRGNGPRTQPS